MNDRRLFLGRVEWLSPSDPRGPIAQLRPLCEAAANSQPWGSPYTADYVRQEFPNRGLVTWFHPTDGAGEGTIWQFKIEEQSRFDASKPFHDAYKVAATPSPPVEVLDLRALGDEEQCRIQLTQDGLELLFIPSGRVFIWTADDCWIGPVHLCRNKDTSYWILDPAQAQRETLPKVQPAPANQIASLDIGTARLLLAPAVRTGPRLGQIDWSTDDVLLKRALRWLRKTDRAYTDALGLTEKAIDRTVNVLQGAGLSSAELTLETQRLRRAGALITSLVDRQDLAEAVMRDLLLVPSIQAGVHAVEESVREETQERVRAELQDSISRTAELRAEQSRLEEEIAALRETLAAEVEDLSATLTARIAELLKRPGQALTELAMLRAALGTGPAKAIPEPPAQPSGGAEGPAAPAPAAAPEPAAHAATTSNADVTLLIDRAQLRSALRGTFRTRGLPPQVARMMHATFLAGAMPILAGGGAQAAVEAYAAAVTGGRWLWLPISPAALEPSDLLGKVDLTSRRFVPAPGGLIDALLHAQRMEGLSLVVLEGVNRAAVDSYLAPLLACYADAWREPGRVLPLFHPAAVSPDDPYASAASIPWPPNVLLAGILSDGAATVPIAPSLWGSATLIHLDAFSTDEPRLDGRQRTNDAGDGSPSSMVSLETWRSWQEQIDARAVSGEAAELIAAIQQGGLQVPREVRELCGRALAAESMWVPVAGRDGGRPMDDGWALESVVLQCFVPLAAVEGKMGLLFEGLDGSVPTTERVERAAALAREALS